MRDELTCYLSPLRTQGFREKKHTAFPGFLRVLCGKKNGGKVAENRRRPTRPRRDDTFFLLQGLCLLRRFRCFLFLASQVIFPTG